MRVSRLSNAIGDASRVRRKCSCDNERTILRSNLSLRPGVRSERDDTGEFGDSQRLRRGCLDSAAADPALAVLAVVCAGASTSRLSGCLITDSNVLHHALRGV